MTTTAAFRSAMRQLARDLSRPRTPRGVRVGDKVVATPSRGRHAAETPLPRRVARYGAAPAALASYAAQQGLGRPHDAAEAQAWQRALTVLGVATVGFLLVPTLAITAALGGFAL